MAQVLSMNELTPDLLSGLVTLCDTPYDIDSFSAVCEINGWRVVPPEDWETGGDPFLRVELSSDGSPLIALWGAETLAGIPLAVIYQDDITAGLTPTALTAFNSLFADAKRVCEIELGRETVGGTYTSQHQPFLLHFAFYRRQHSTFALLQHDEGDGHLGNDASLDIRIIPKTPELIELPLVTDLIF